MSRRRGWIFGLLGLSLALSWFFARRGPASQPMPHSECLTHADCQTSERCVVVPKGDGFANFGRCGEQCTNDDACLNGWTCRAWLDEKGYLSPERGRDPGLPRVRACAHHTVQ